MPRILLTTLNATYFHCALGLRYLYANLGELREDAEIVEFTLDQSARDVVESLLALEPRIVGFSVYVWNTRQTQDVVSLLKRVSPGTVVIVGGPEVSYETETQPLAQLADRVVRGEGDLAFAELCRGYLRDGTLPPARIVGAPLPEVTALASPYPYYSDEDIRHRVIYVEASRGCAYKCEFCLSSLDKSVRAFDLDRFLDDMRGLIARGARQFKFVDRTFNLHVAKSARILDFFLEHVDLGLFLHFEMVPDRLPAELRDRLRKFPAGSVQLEIGIQTWNPDVSALVSRRQDYEKLTENFTFLLAETGAHLHADLIVGLPGETQESFGRGFDAVAKLRSHEVQVGMLKRLKGTPIIRHDREWEMVYDEAPPFQVLSTKTMPFAVLQEMGRFAKFWDLYANRGNFPNTMQLLHDAAPSLFAEFLQFTRFLSARHKKLHSIALLSLVESAWLYLRAHRTVTADAARAALVRDYTGYVKRDVPAFLRETPLARPLHAPELASALPARQRRHLGIPVA